MTTLTNRDITARTLTAISQDTFVRANQSGWGTASDTETWTSQAGSATASIASNEGKLATTSGTNILTLGTRTAADVNLLVRFALSTTSSGQAGFVFRFNTTANYYRVIVQNGVYNCIKNVGGSGTTLTVLGGTGTATLTNTTFYWIRVVAEGSTIVSRVWADGGSEPTTWNRQWNDSSFLSANKFGLLGNTGTNGDTVQFDHFSVTDAFSYANRDVSSRLILALGTNNKDIASRTRVQAVSSRDISVRTRLQALISRDTVSRLRVQVVSLKDSIGRLKLQAIFTRDTSSRTRIESQTNRSLSSRTILGVQLLQDVAVRLLLTSQVTRLRDAVARARIAALSLQDVRSRLRAQALLLRSLPLRLILVVLKSSDINSRVQLSSMPQRDIGGRTRVKATGLRDLRERLTLASLLLRDTPARARVAAQVRADATSRARVLATTTREVQSRSILGVPLTRDLSFRSSVAARVAGNIRSLLGVDAATPRDVTCLLFLKINPSTGIFLYPLPAPVGFRGVGVGPGVGQPADTIGGPRQ